MGYIENALAAEQLNKLKTQQAQEMARREGEAAAMASLASLFAGGNDYDAAVRDVAMAPTRGGLAFSAPSLVAEPPSYTGGM